MTRRSRALGLLAGWSFVLFGTACTHSLRIVDAEETHSPSRLERSVRIAVRSGVNSGEYDERLLVDFVYDALIRHSSVERVALAGYAPPDFEPDLLVTLTPRTEYDGSGLNFLITFPGFIVFTHAWNGFNYEADVETDVIVATPDGRELGRTLVPANYDLRHSSFFRGAMTSSGWYTPFWGAINIVIGGFMVRYDDDATEPFLDEVRDRYGRMVADQVILIARDHIAASLPPPVAPEVIRVEPVVEDDSGGI